MLGHPFLHKKKQPRYLWELFGKENASEARSEAFLEVPSGIEPL